MGSWLSGMKKIGSIRLDSDSNTLKWEFLDLNWLEQRSLGLSMLFLLYKLDFLAVLVVRLA